MYRIVRKSALLLATLTASLSMSPIVRADVTPQQQYQPQSQSQQCVPPPPPAPPSVEFQRSTPVENSYTNSQHAQTQTQAQYQQPSTNNYTAPAQSANTNDPLTDEQLGTMLRNFGLEPTTSRNDAGGTTYAAKIERDGWSFNVSFAISSDRTNLWLSQSLTKLSGRQSVSASALLKLMEWNNGNTAMFSVDAQNGNRIVLAQPLANQALSAGKVHKALDNFLGSIEKSESLWSEKALSVASNATAYGN